MKHLQIERFVAVDNLGEGSDHAHVPVAEEVRAGRAPSADHRHLRSWEGAPRGVARPRHGVASRRRGIIARGILAAAALGLMASKTPRAYSGDARVGTPRTACSLSSSSVRASGTSLHRHDGDTPCTNRSGRPQLSKSSRIGCSASSPRVWSMTLSLARGGSGVSGVASIVSLGLFTSPGLVSSVVGMRARAGYPRRATTRVMMVCTRKSWFRLGDKIQCKCTTGDERESAREHEYVDTTLIKVKPRRAREHPPRADQMTSHPPTAA